MLSPPDSLDVDWRGILADDESLPAEGGPQDLNRDDTVSVADLLLLLTELGCTEGYVADINGDEMVGVSDVLSLLS